MGVSAQTVSRWECGTTCPDIMLLPEIARLYCVTVDDLFKDNPSAYENLFQRLACVYEKTKQPEDFIRADIEFKNMIKTAEYSLEDMRMYALIHQFMMGHCKNKAGDLYNEALEKGKNSPDKAYWLTKCAKANFSVITGCADEFIAEQTETVNRNPDNADELCVLIRALYYAKRYSEGYELFTKAKRKFTHTGNLYLVGGDICNKLERYEEAFENWDKAIGLNDGFSLDGKYSKVHCYEGLGEYQKAYNIRLEIIDELKKGGYDIEAATEEIMAYVCLEKITN